MRKGDFEDHQSRMQSLARSEESDENTEESDDESDPMYCNVCGRYIGNKQRVWSYDPTICTESCAERRAQRNRD